MPNEGLTIGALLQPIPGRGSDRRVWSIQLQGVWIPFFTASNTTGESAIAHEVLGAPLRLQHEKDGTPKFSKNGRPVIRVVKELSDQIRIVRENFAYGLLTYAVNVQKAMPDEYKAQLEANMKAGEGIVHKDETDLADFLAAEAEAAVAEAEGIAAKAAEAESAATAAPAPVAAEATQPSQELEAVPA